ncbi:hypothetical protein M758_1G034600 [Ceratodon purpureus]|uniref:Uncharacterized protein n=1 Tax=Ceratodon purpureus TaxID=3225 RepID=A0A8T0J3E6_CERPU|nr:hypothetical protein KC19_1G036600 [Ceratodon purpureus]KAG0628541.1 hypothetical protein M758_1G034600 [Ceratodon purpureus]
MYNLRQQQVAPNAECNPTLDQGINHMHLLQPISSTSSGRRRRRRRSGAPSVHTTRD